MKDEDYEEGNNMSFIKALKNIEYNDELVELNPRMLDKLQNKLLIMISDISQVLDAKEIKWSLSGGSVIGAVRHKGFIPWDDDIDIFMTREEFEKFKKIFDETLGDRYRLKIPGDKGYLFSMPKIEDKCSSIQSIQSVGDNSSGVFIDVFLLENTYQNKALRIVNGLICSAFLFIDSSLRLELCKNNIVRCAKNGSEVIKILNSRIKWAFLFKFFPLEKWLFLSDQYFSHIKKKSEYLVCPSGGGHFFGETYDSDKMTNTTKVQFETLMLPIPTDYKHYLIKHYGEKYMEIPPENKRERHIYIKFALNTEPTETSGGSK